MGDEIKYEEMESVGIDEIENSAELVPLGQVSIYRSMDPAEQLSEARARARVLVEVVKEQGLSKTFRKGAKPHVFVEGWQFLGSQFGLIPDIEWTRELDGGAGWEARASLVRLSDGQVIAHAEGECRRDEDNWKDRASYAIRSMAQTRAVSKVCRVALSSVMVMAGFNATPAEEISDDMMNPYGDGVERHCPACLDKLGTLVKVSGPHDRKPYWRCTADPQDCGGYRTYQGKEYSWSGWRTDWDNAVAEYRNDVIKNDPQTVTIDVTERTQRSGHIVNEIMRTTGLTNENDAKVLVKPGLIVALESGGIDGVAALGGKPSDNPSDEELRVIVANLTLAEAEAVIDAAVSLKPERKKK